GPEGEAIYEPGIIVQLSAIGAVGGLLVGAAMMPALLLSSAENLLVRRVIGPGLYSVIILGTSLGLAPIGQTGGQLLDMNRPLLGIDGSRCGGDGTRWDGAYPRSVDTGVVYAASASLSE